MSYTFLKKLSFQDAAAWKTLYNERFHSPDTLHLNFHIHDNPAFISMTGEVYTLLLSIHKVDKKVRALRSELPPDALVQFSRRCLIDEIMLTNDIEGVYSTRREIFDVLKRDISERKNARFEGLIHKYVLLQEGASIPLSTCQELRTLYDEIVLDEVLKEDPNDMPDGKIFRKGPVSIDPGTGKEIHRGIMPEAAIIDAIKNALDFLHNPEIDLLVRVSAFHYLLGYIHPFYNGNGRLSRFVSSYMFCQELDPLIAYRLSYTIKTDISKYHAAFKECNDPRNLGDITPFVLQFLGFLLQAMEQLEEALSKRAARLAALEEKICEDPLLGSDKYHHLSLLLLQAGLFSEIGISTTWLLSLLSISRATLRNRLEVLNTRNLLTCVRRDREKYYKLNWKYLE